MNAHPEYHTRMVKKLSEITGLELQTSDNLFEIHAIHGRRGRIFILPADSRADVDPHRQRFPHSSLQDPSDGFDEIRLPAVPTGSSIMPGKVNPVLAEMLDQAMFHVVGCDTTVAMAVQAGQLELNVMMPIIAHNLFGDWRDSRRVRVERASRVSHPHGEKIIRDHRA
ncbi:MAG: lyase family protein [Anaerolineales bacterium]